MYLYTFFYEDHCQLDKVQQVLRDISPGLVPDMTNKVLSPQSLQRNSP